MTKTEQLMDLEATSYGVWRSLNADYTYSNCVICREASENESTKEFNLRKMLKNVEYLANLPFCPN
jgi:hypothetical protein